MDYRLLWTVMVCAFIGICLVQQAESMAFKQKSRGRNNKNNSKRQRQRAKTREERRQRQLAFKTHAMRKSATTSTTTTYLPSTTNIPVNPTTGVPEVVPQVEKHQLTEKERLIELFDRNGPIEIDSTVLFDPKTGKELVAEEIQNASASNHRLLPDYQNAGEESQNLTRQQIIWMERNRAREARTMHILARIMFIVGVRNPGTNVEKPEPDLNTGQLFDKMNVREEDSEHDYLFKRMQSELPSCNNPNTADDRWKLQDAYRLYFELDQFDDDMDPLLKHNSSLKSSYLRLYMKEQDKDEDCDCQPSVHRSRHTGTRRHVRLEEEEQDEEVDEEDDEPMLSVTVWKYTRIFKKKRGQYLKTKKKLQQETVISRDHTGWLRIDILAAVKWWYENPNRNLGLEITVKDANGQDIDPFSVFEGFNCTGSSKKLFSKKQLLPVPFPSDDSVDNNTLTSYNGNMTFPALDIETVVKQDHDLKFQDFIPRDSELAEEKQEEEKLEIESKERPLDLVSEPTTETPGDEEGNEKGRRRRAAPVTTNLCKRENHFVSLADMGKGMSDIIIQPQGFEAGICAGTCKRPNMSSFFSNNTFDVGRYQCCGPTVLEPLRLLYYDEKYRLRIAIVENMVVAECGCRPYMSSLT